MNNRIKKVISILISVIFLTGDAAFANPQQENRLRAITVCLAPESIFKTENMDEAGHSPAFPGVFRKLYARFKARLSEGSERRRYLKDLRSAYNILKGKSVLIKTIFYPAMGYDVDSVFGVLDADTVIAVDPMTWDKDGVDFEEKYVFRLIALGARNIEIKAGSNRAVIISFNYKKRARKIILYKEPIEGFEIENNEYTREGYDMLFIRGMPLSVYTSDFLSHALGNLRTGGLFLGHGRFMHRGRDREVDRILTGLEGKRLVEKGPFGQYQDAMWIKEGAVTVSFVLSKTTVTDEYYRWIKRMSIAKLEGPVTGFVRWIDEVFSQRDILSDRELEETAARLNIGEERRQKLMEEAKVRAGLSYGFSKSLPSDGKSNVYIFRDASPLYSAEKVRDGGPKALYLSKLSFKKLSGLDVDSIAFVIRDVKEQMHIEWLGRIPDDKLDDFKLRFMEFLEGVLIGREDIINGAKNARHYRKNIKKYNRAARRLFRYLDSLGLNNLEACSKGIRFIDTSAEGTFVLFLEALARIRLKRAGLRYDGKIDSAMFYSRLCDRMGYAKTVKEARAVEYLNYPVEFDKNSGERMDFMPVFKEGRSKRDKEIKREFLFQMIALRNELLKLRQKDALPAAAGGGRLIGKLYDENGNIVIEGIEAEESKDSRGRKYVYFKKNGAVLRNAKGEDAPDYIGKWLILSSEEWQRIEELDRQLGDIIKESGKVINMELIRLRMEIADTRKDINKGKTDGVKDRLKRLEENAAYIILRLTHPETLDASIVETSA